MAGNYIKGILHQKIFYRLNLIFWIEVWYSSFWSEGPKNHRNLKILVSNFVPRGFEARRTWGSGCPSRSHLITRDLEGQREMINHWSVLSVRRPSKSHGAVPYTLYPIGYNWKFWESYWCKRLEKFHVGGFWKEPIGTCNGFARSKK